MVFSVVFRPPRLRPEQFVPGNKEHVAILKSMGITVIQTEAGRIQLLQSAAGVRSTILAERHMLISDTHCDCYMKTFTNED